MAEKQQYSKEFEDYWKAHEQSLIAVAPKVLREERANNGKMNTAGDWLLYIIPFLAGVGFMNAHLLKGEMLNFIIGLVVAVVCFGLTIFIRPYITGKRNIVDIDADIKDYFYSVYTKEGLDALEALRA